MTTIPRRRLHGRRPRPARHACRPAAPSSRRIPTRNCCSSARRARARHGLRHRRAAAIVPATEVVAMDDPVEVALRKKKDSSMRVAIQQVKDGRAPQRRPRLGRQHRRADGGGALRAEDARRHRPAGDRRRTAQRARAAPPRCSTSAPTSIARPQHLLQFAVMGSALVSAIDGPREPDASACSTSAKKRSRAAK